MISNTPASSMPAPLIAAPLTHQGVRYQQDAHLVGDGKEAGAAYLAAVDSQNNQKLWTLKIESGAKGAPLFAFDFYAHLTRIEAGPEADVLLVSSNSNKRYRVNIRTQQIIDMTQLANDATDTHTGIPPLAPAQVFDLPPMHAATLLHDRISHKGVLYRQGTSKDDIAADSDESWLVAEDEQTGRLLWRVKVGSKPATLAPDSQWQREQLLFSDISLGPGEDTLTIVDYLGRHFLVDLKTRSVTPLASKSGSDMFEPELDPLPPGLPGQ